MGWMDDDDGEDDDDDDDDGQNVSQTPGRI